MINRIKPACGFLLLWAVFSVANAEPPSFLSSEPLPNIEIDGKDVKIHSQGLFVTESEYIVTGRVDSPPRHPVMLSFSREDVSSYQRLDLSLPTDVRSELNHPGGFDRDRHGFFWIPLSTSHPRGPTTVLGIKLEDGRLPQSVAEISDRFELADHVGAICCLDDGRLLGANWDTKQIHVIDPVAEAVIETVSHEDFFTDANGVRLAVQDWKFDRPNQRILAAGIDKSKQRKPDDSNAVLAHIDPVMRKVTSLQRLPARSDVGRPLTNEGMAIHAGRLYLLPEDFGRGAKVLQFEWEPN